MNRQSAKSARHSVASRRRWPAVIAAILAVMATSNAEALTCAPAPVETLTKNVPVIFTGRVIASELYDPYAEPTEEYRRSKGATFQVLIPWKGVAKATVVVRPGPYHAVFEEGRSYTVFAHPASDGSLWVSPCEEPYADTSTIVSALNKLRPEFSVNPAPSVQPRHAGTLIARAAFWASYRDHETALALYASVLEENPLDVEALIGRAQLLMSLKRYDLALNDINAILGHDFEHKTAKRWRSSVLFNLSRFLEFEAEVVDLSRDDYRSINASGVKIPEADLSWSNFRDVQFNHADLSGASLHFVRLTGVSFRNAKLTEADLRGSMLHNVDFSGADLSNADLRNTEMFSANLLWTRLDGAKYNSRTRWPKGFDPESAGAVRAEEN